MQWYKNKSSRNRVIINLYTEIGRLQEEGCGVQLWCTGIPMYVGCLSVIRFE